MNRHDLVRFQAPELPRLDEIATYYRMSEDVQWYSNFGPCHELLTQRLRSYLGNGCDVLPVANATIGLMAALSVLLEPGRRRGGLVAVPSFTFAATGNAIAWVGCQPLFVDVDPDHWHMAPGALEEALTAHGSDVVAVLACSTFGTPPPRRISEQWSDVAGSAGVPLLVDSAAGFGGRDENGVALGAQGDAEVFSFHATKPFGVGEGGLITSRDPATIARTRQAINFAFDEQRLMTSPLGVNGKMSELHAATALCVLDRHDGVLSRRRDHANRLRKTALAMGLAVQSGGERSASQFFPVLARSGEERARMEASSQLLGVETRRYFPQPLHRASFWADAPRTDLSETDRLAEAMLCMPLYNSMSDGALELIEQSMLASEN